MAFLVSCCVRNLVEIGRELIEIRLEKVYSRPFLGRLGGGYTLLMGRSGPYLTQCSLGPHECIFEKVYLRNHNRCFFTCSPRPPTLSERHMDLHVWVGVLTTWLYIRSFIKIRSGVSEPQGVRICPFPLLWLLAFTTACDVSGLKLAS